MCMNQAIPTNTEIPSTDPVELSKDDLDDLLESAGLLLDSLICGDPMKYVQPDFHDTVSRETAKLLVNQTFGLCDEKTISDIVGRALSTFYAHVYPRRSYDSTFIRITPKVQPSYQTSSSPERYSTARTAHSGMVCIPPQLSHRKQRLESLRFYCYPEPAYL